MKALPSIEQFENDALPALLVAIFSNIQVITYKYTLIIEINFYVPQKRNVSKLSLIH